MGYNATGVVVPPSSTADKIPPCLEKIAKAIQQQAESNSFEGDPYRDDKYAYYMDLRLFAGSNAYVGTLPNKAECTLISHPAGKGGIQTDWYHFSGDTKGTYCLNGYFYMDNNCKIVSASKVEQLCGSIATVFSVNYLKSCPVSLLWSPDFDIDAHSTLVTFPLEPGVPGKWYQWKASAQAPLLVYDPAHTGQITSGSQLFGNWTFGGDRSAALNGAGAIAQPWRDGFEALSQLDADGDDKISGAELDPLGLWFDENQDGVAQPGEVKSLAEMEVTALFFQADTVDPVTGTAHARLGFERVVAGRTIRGSAVDWFGKRGDSQFDLISGYLMPELTAAPVGTASSAAANDHHPAKPREQAAAVNTSAASGVWEWRFSNSPKGVRPAGFLFLDENRTSGEVRGYAASSITFAHSPGSTLNSAIGVHAVLGARTAAAGRSTLRFVSEYDGMRMQNEAELSSDGTRLSGTSTVSFSEGGKSRTLSYQWKARRLER